MCRVATFEPRQLVQRLKRRYATQAAGSVPRTGLERPVYRQMVATRPRLWQARHGKAISSALLSRGSQSRSTVGGSLRDRDCGTRHGSYFVSVAEPRFAESRGCASRIKTEDRRMVMKTKSDYKLAACKSSGVICEWDPVLPLGQRWPRRMSLTQNLPALLPRYFTHQIHCKMRPMQSPAYSHPPLGRSVDFTPVECAAVGVKLFAALSENGLRGGSGPKA